MASVETKSLREEQMDRTRGRILAAAAELLVNESLAELTVPAVAERAGMSVRTVYRHFPTKETLIEGVADFGTVRTKAAFPLASAGTVDVAELLPHLWTELMEHADFVRAQKLTSGGRTLRKVRTRRRIDDIAHVLKRELPELAASDQRRLAGALSWLMSSSSMLELLDYVDLRLEEAAELAVWVIEAAIERARQEGSVAR